MRGLHEHCMPVQAWGSLCQPLINFYRASVQVHKCMSYQMAYQNVISYVVRDVCSDIYNFSKLIVIHLAHLLTKLEAKS